MTWRAESGQLDVWVNRDEKRNRLPGQPPRILRTQWGTLHLAPGDTDRGGTWVAVNEHGLVACLLNYYQAEYATPVRGTTRGELPLRVMDATRLAEVEFLLTDELATRYKAFLLVVLDADGRGREFRWDGLKFQRHDIGTDALPVTTSSYETTAVTAHRRGLWQAMLGECGGKPGVDEHERFHLRDEPGRTAFGVCMRRPDAQSVSFTRVSVGPETIRVRYQPLMDAMPGPSSTVELPRAKPATTRARRVSVQTAEAS
jgi:hypothetical protein